MTVDVDAPFAPSLRDFLASRFRYDELATLVADLPDGTALSSRLRHEVSPYERSVDVVRLTIDHGHLDALRHELLDRRPEDRRYVEAIWRLPPPDDGDAIDAGPPAPLPPPALPPRPPHFVERPEHVAIADALLSDDPLVGITGLPGSGKTTAAIAALTASVQDAFGHVCWLAWDKEPAMNASDVRTMIAGQLGRQRSDVSAADLSSLVASSIEDRRLLVVLDDPRGRMDELIDAARCRESCHVLVTTSDQAALGSVGVPDPFRLAGLPIDAAHTVLAGWAGVDIAVLPDPAVELAAAIGHHALGLRILGAAAAGSADKVAQWRYLRQRMYAAEFSAEFAPPGIPDGNLAALLASLVEQLPDASAAVADALAVVPRDAGLTAEAIATIAMRDTDECRRAADRLVQQSLARGANGRYALHPIVHLVVREREGFTAHADQALERLDPSQPPISHSIAAGDRLLARRLMDREDVAALTASTAGVGSPFHQAAYFGMLDVLDEMASRGAHVRALDAQGMTALHYAAERGHVDVVRRLIELGVSPLGDSADEPDPLRFAISHRRFAVAEALLEAVPEDPSNAVRLTRPMQLAVYHGALGLVRHMLELGGPHDPDLDDETSLLGVAINEGHVAVADALLAHDAVFRDDTLGESLVFAAQSGDAAMTRRLLSMGADADWVMPDGRTALMQAALQGHAEAVAALLKAGAATTPADANGWQAVHLAAAFHRDDVIYAMAAAGVDIDAEGPLQVRPLALTVDRAAPGATMRSTMSVDGKGFRASSFVVLSDVDPAVVRTVDALLATGVEVNATDVDGRTALHRAVTGNRGLLVGYPALVSTLVRHGADPDRPDTSGQTPRAIASARADQRTGGLVDLRADAVLTSLQGEAPAAAP